jgi:hypothetical protein
VVQLFSKGQEDLLVVQEGAQIDEGSKEALAGAVEAGVRVGEEARSTLRYSITEPQIERAHQLPTTCTTNEILCSSYLLCCPVNSGMALSSSFSLRPTSLSPKAMERIATNCSHNSGKVKE